MTKANQVYKIYATGHRPKDLPGGYELESDDNRKLSFLMTNALESLIKSDYDIEVVSGMAQGVDTLFFLVGVGLRNKYPGRVIVHSVIPSLGQADKWPQKSKEHWAHLRTQADKETVVYKGEYQPWILMARNKVMAEISDMCISVWNGDVHGGTFNATKYSVKKGQKVLRIDPVSNSYKGILTEEEFDKIIRLSKPPLNYKVTGGNLELLVDRFEWNAMSYDEQVDYTIENGVEVGGKLMFNSPSSIGKLIVEEV